MSDFFRRASDAFHHRQRQDSAGSTGSTGSTDATDAAKFPDTKKPTEQEPLSQTTQSVQPDSHVNEAFAGTATGNVANPKQRRHWAWGHHQGNKPGTDQQPTQEHQPQKDTDWVFGT
ncbi:hypothetical protein N7474_008698 [Penicillium riverlandense]|uniref:uncharacterized protein n=1 Tax=Penicillium riverlandense TaxID=1903569 RepID=UPI0025474683|nr:uncharacterized protein N7474_008698 [Penicillium riverlandense]KAJ5812397.1 hypothetical protein N7474_008698 [Penicillium riverlandense]